MNVYFVLAKNATHPFICWTTLKKNRRCWRLYDPFLIRTIRTTFVHLSSALLNRKHLEKTEVIPKWQFYPNLLSYLNLPATSGRNGKQCQSEKLICFQNTSKVDLSAFYFYMAFSNLKQLFQWLDRTKPNNQIQVLNLHWTNCFKIIKTILFQIPLLHPLQN